MQRKKVLFFAAVFTIFGVDFAKATLLDIHIANAPPVTMTANAAGYGIVGDIALAAVALAGYKPQIQDLPWPRSQLLVSSGKNQLIIPLSRTTEREDKFTWIAPIMPMERAFFTLDTPVSSFSEAKKRYRAIAVGAGTAQLEILKQQGFSESQIHILKLGDSPLRMLQLRRIDAWFTGVPEGQYEWPEREMNSIAAKLKMSPVLHSVDLYLACSIDCEASLVTRLRSAVNSLRADGTIKKVTRAYLAKQ